jgi:hypothetical protein
MRVPELEPQFLLSDPITIVRPPNPCLPSPTPPTPLKNLFTVHYPPFIKTEQ